ncbi:MAG: DNA replication/repair protein RecF [Alkaliphilus sp.]
MIIKGLKIINFRKYDNLSLEFHPKMNIFVGDNAKGKTNIIEAMYICAIGKSFRTTNHLEMIKEDKEEAYTKIAVLRKERKVDIEIVLGKRKEIRINKKKVNKKEEFLGNLNVVIFAPEDLKIIKEGPMERRNFIDNEIAQIYPRYYNILKQYNRILKQRNMAIKINSKKRDSIEMWDEQLLNTGALLIAYRKKFIRKLNLITKPIHSRITEGKEKIEIMYKSCVNQQEEDETKKIHENFKNQLKNTWKEEKKGFTIIGPHRDDLVFYINKKNVKKYASQGQQRTTILSLKLAEIELIKEEIEEYPVLLLDDVMSELDKKRQKQLLENLEGIQTFITTTTIDKLNNIEKDNKKVFYVSEDSVDIYPKR